GDAGPPGNAAPPPGEGPARARPPPGSPEAPHSPATPSPLGTSSTSSMMDEPVLVPPPRQPRNTALPGNVEHQLDDPPPSPHSLPQTKPRLGSHNPPLIHSKPQPVHCSFSSLQLILQAVTEWTPSMTPARNQHLGWYQARKLPHYDAPHVLQFI